ncbi:MAG: NTP transferase domain-containing protein [Stagnimonas sp.]|nr:NTP transferase domain-containing protein [Stagnimonas sp.]
MSAGETGTGVTVLVLAGSRGPDDPLTRATGLRHKALLPVAGVPMLLRVLRALAATPEVARIAVCIEDPTLIAGLLADFRRELGARALSVETLNAAISPSRSAAAGLAQLGTPLLVTTADHALLQPAWVSHFLNNQPAGATATVALARAEAVLRDVPGTQRTFLRFADGAYSACNLFYLARPEAAQLLQLWQQVEALRKQPVKMLRLLGLRYALGYRCGWLRLAQATRRLGLLAGGVTVAAVDMPYGRAAVDVDKPSDLELVERLLADDAGATSASP